MSTTEIIAELPRLSLEELTQVQAKLFELVGPTVDSSVPHRIYTPRLARSEQAKDFIKQVIELSPDASL